MKKSCAAVFLVAGILLSLVFLAGCVLPHQILPVPSKQSTNHQNLSTTASITLDDANWSALKQFPPEIQGEIQTLAEKYSIAPEYWWFDRVKNKICLFSDGTPDKNAIKDLQGKQIGNYTIYIEGGLPVNHAMNY